MSLKPAEKTLAMRLLEGKKIPYEAHRYDPELYVSAEEVAEAIGMPPQQVFKTIVTEPDKGKPILALVPADAEVDLKALAEAAGVKKVRLATQAEAERLTGLEKGGISALALVNRGFAIYLDRTALTFDRIGMSAGERGVQVVLAPAEFIKVTGARIASARRALVTILEEQPLFNPEEEALDEDWATPRDDMQLLLRETAAWDAASDEDALKIEGLLLEMS